MDIVENKNVTGKKVLIVDCGKGKGEGRINESNFDSYLSKMNLNEKVRSYAFWLTHLHADHFELALKQSVPGSKNRILEQMCYTFAGVGEGFSDYPYCPASTEKVKELVKLKINDKIGDIIAKQKKNEMLSEEEQKAIEAFQKKKKDYENSNLGKMCAYLKLTKNKDSNKCFPIKIWDYDSNDIKTMQDALNKFTKDTNCSLRPLLPDKKKGYGEDSKGKKKEPTSPNGQSLVLALKYGDRNVIFPGDAPGDLFLALVAEDQKYVSAADVLIAPHHGSVNNREDLWETYDVNSRLRRRYCTIVSSIPVAGDYIPNERFINFRPSRSAFVAEEHSLLVYDQRSEKNRKWETKQTKFSMDENIYYYRCYLGKSFQARPSERVIEIMPRENESESGWEEIPLTLGICSSSH
jgi:hypothetical protein